MRRDVAEREPSCLSDQCEGEFVLTLVWASGDLIDDVVRKHRLDRLAERRFRQVTKDINGLPGKGRPERCDRIQPILQLRHWTLPLPDPSTRRQRDFPQPDASAIDVTDARTNRQLRSRITFRIAKKRSFNMS